MLQASQVVEEGGFIKVQFWQGHTPEKVAEEEEEVVVLFTVEGCCCIDEFDEYTGNCISCCLNRDTLRLGLDRINGFRFKLRTN